MKTHARTALLALVATFAVVAGATLAFGNPLPGAEVTVPDCVPPTGTVTNAKHLAYDQCRFDRLEAQNANLHPVPTITATVTVTETVTPSPSPTASSTPDPTPAPTPTSPPPTTTALKGWELVPSGTGANVGLAGVGLTCGGLATYSGPSVIPTGTTITSKRFTDRIDVSAGNITIEKSCFQSSNPQSANDGLVEGYYPQGDITIRDSEFDGSLLAADSRDSACAMAGGVNMIRNYIHDVGSGICEVSTTNTRDTGNIPHDIVVKNNYVHKMTSCCGAHHEAATVRDFVPNGADDRTMKWIGNWLDITQTEYVSGGLFLQATFEPIHNLWLNDNVFAGEGFNLVIDPAIMNLHVVNNRFKPGTREYYGPVDGGRASAVEWSENYMYDGSKAEAKGAAVTP